MSNSGSGGHDGRGRAEARAGYGRRGLVDEVGGVEEAGLRARAAGVVR